MVSLILLLISSRSPSINAMGSTCVLSYFIFFHVPPFFSLPRLFKIKGVHYPSSPLPPCPETYSSSVFDKGDLSPYYDSHCSCSAFSLAAHSCFMRAFSPTAFFFYSTRVCTSFLVTSFIFFAIELSAPMLIPISNSDGAHHSVGHNPTTS